jgi:hypothetical protein
VVEAVDLGLEGEDVFGVTDVAAEVGGHRGGVAEEGWEDAAVGGDDGILGYARGVEDVEGGRAVVGVDDDFDAVADVVHGVVAEGVVGGIGVGVGSGVGVEDPGEFAGVADDEVGVLVEGEEGGEGGYALADVAAHEEAAVRGDVVAEGELADVAAIEGEEDAAEEASEADASCALVGGEIVALALGVVELLLMGVDIDVRVGQLAEVDFRASDVDGGRGGLDGHVAEEEEREAFGGEAVDGIHGDAVAVGVGEALVDPVAGADGELVNVEFASGEHDFAGGAVDVVAVDVDVGKIVVGADFLNLAERVLKGVPIPEADVMEGGLVIGGVGCLDGGFGGKFLLMEAVETEGGAGFGDVVSDEGLFADELIGLDDEVGDVPTDEAQDDIAECGGGDRGGDEAAARDAEGVDSGHDRTGDEGERYNEESADGDVRVGVVEAVEDGVVFEEERVAADVDHAGDDEKEEGKGDGEASPGRAGYACGALVEGASAAGDDEVDGSGGADGQGQG